MKKVFQNLRHSRECHSRCPKGLRIWYTLREGNPEIRHFIRNYCVPAFAGMTIMLLVAVVGLTGCRPQEKETGIILEFWTLQLLGFSDVLKPMFSEYERTHPGVKIKWVDVPFSEGEKRTLTAVLSPHAPDVVNLNPDFSATLATRQALIDMNDAVSEKDRAVYLPVAWKSCELGKTAFGIPWYLTSRVTLYNRQLLRQAGVTQPPKTYEELLNLSQTMAKNKKGYALMPSLSEGGNFLKELKKTGIDAFDASGHAVFASKEAVAFLENWVHLYKNKWVPPESLTEGHRAAVDRYQSGTLALLLSGPNFLNIVQENAPKIFQVTDVAPQFPQDAAAVDFSTMVLVVPRKSAHPEEAVDFALFITNARNQLAFSLKAPVLPSVESALKDPYFQAFRSANVIDRARSISARQLLSASDVYQIRPRQSEINEIVNQAVQQALLGKYSAREALITAQNKVNVLLREP